jgi:hypothetical protein
MRTLDAGCDPVNRAQSPGVDGLGPPGDALAGVSQAWAPMRVS